jgi:6-phosphofructokinase 1
MNAAIRAVVRIGLDQGCETLGIRYGFTGLMSGELIDPGPGSVGGMVQQGGTMLGGTRCDEFRTEAGRRRALSCLEQRGIDGLVVIGGNGSQQGSHLPSKMGLPVVGVASTIDFLVSGRHGVLCGLVAGDVVATPPAEVVVSCECLDPMMLRLAPVLAA